MQAANCLQRKIQIFRFHLTKYWEGFHELLNRSLASENGWGQRQLSFFAIERAGFATPTIRASTPSRRSEERFLLGRTRRGRASERRCNTAASRLRRSL